MTLCSPHRIFTAPISRHRNVGAQTTWRNLLSPNPMRLTSVTFACHGGLQRLSRCSPLAPLPPPLTTFMGKATPASSIIGPRGPCCHPPASDGRSAMLRTFGSVLVVLLLALLSIGAPAPRASKMDL